MIILPGPTKHPKPLTRRPKDRRSSEHDLLRRSARREMIGHDDQLSLGFRKCVGGISRNDDIIALRRRGGTDSFSKQCPYFEQEFGKTDCTLIMSYRETRAHQQCYESALCADWFETACHTSANPTAGSTAVFPYFEADGPAAATSPEPASRCCSPAPPRLRFSSAGRVDRVEKRARQNTVLSHEGQGLKHRRENLPRKFHAQQERRDGPEFVSSGRIPPCSKVSLE